MLSQLSRLTKGVSCTYKLNPRFTIGSLVSAKVVYESDLK